MFYNLSLSPFFLYSLDNKQDCDVVYLDFSKAFDRVPHESVSSGCRRGGGTQLD